MWADAAGLGMCAVVCHLMLMAVFHSAPTPRFASPPPPTNTRLDRIEQLLEKLDSRIFALDQRLLRVEEAAALRSPPTPRARNFKHQRQTDAAPPPPPGKGRIGSVGTGSTLAQALRPLVGDTADPAEPQASRGRTARASPTASTPVAVDDLTALPPWLRSLVSEMREPGASSSWVPPEKASAASAEGEQSRSSSLRSTTPKKAVAASGDGEVTGVGGEASVLAGATAGSGSSPAAAPAREMAAAGTAATGDSAPPTPPPPPPPRKRAPRAPEKDWEAEWEEEDEDEKARKASGVSSSSSLLEELNRLLKSSELMSEGGSGTAKKAGKKGRIKGAKRRKKSLAETPSSEGSSEEADDDVDDFVIEDVD